MIAAALFALTAAVAGPEARAMEAELDRARAEVAGEVHLVAFDLVDELVFRLARDPVFGSPEPVVLAGVSVPVGMGSTLQALLENHIASVLLQNPRAHMQLVHCPACTAVVVHSGSQATVVSRGVDDPAVLAKVGARNGRYALFVDVEAEGAFLVLRARLTELSAELPIVWAQTIASSGSAAAMLRHPRDLKSATDARKEYLDVLRDRGSISVPLRIGLRTYAQPGSERPVPPPPFLWVQSGVELGSSPAQAWTASLLVGYSFVPQAYQGIMAQARFHRLVTGAARSHVRPDLYAFFGAAVFSVWGPATEAFRDDLLTADDVIQLLEEDGNPRTTFGGLQVGLDLRMGQRVGLSTFLETLPTLNNSRNVGEHIILLGIPFHSFGTEVSLWF